MKPQIKLLFLTALIISSCTVKVNEVETKTTTSYSTEQSEAIDTNIRSQIKQMNDIVVKSIFNDNPEDLKPIMSDNFLEHQPENFNSTIISMRDYLRSEKYSIFTEYYTKSSEKLLNIKISTDMVNDTNNFDIKYKLPSDESYVSLLIQNVGGSEMFITTLYSKYNTNWKLEAVNISNYTAYGHTSTQYFYESKKEQENGRLLSAYNYMTLSQINSQPGLRLIEYENTAEMDEYYIELLQEINETYKFPLNINNNYAVAGFSMDKTSNFEYFPKINIQTKTKLSNKEKLVNDSDYIIEELDSILPNITSGFSHIFITFYNEIIEGEEVETYSIIKELNVR